MRPGNVEGGVCSSSGSPAREGPTLGHRASVTPRSGAVSGRGGSRPPQGSLPSAQRYTVGPLLCWDTVLCFPLTGVRRNQAVNPPCAGRITGTRCSRLGVCTCAPVVCVGGVPCAQCWGHRIPLSICVTSPLVDFVSLPLLMKMARSPSRPAPLSGDPPVIRLWREHGQEQDPVRGLCRMRPSHFPGRSGSYRPSLPAGPPRRFGH